MRPTARWLLPLLASAYACGAATADPTAADFDVLRIDVGHPTAAVAILHEAGDDGPYVAVVGGGAVTILRPSRDGSLEVSARVPAGDHPVDLAAADLDHDGALDLVVANHERGYLTLVFGTESGFADATSRRLPVDVSPHPHAVAVADIDEDGHPDILVDDRDRERLRVYRGAGDGSFEEGLPISVGGDPYRGMSVADLDGDGHLDVVTPNPRSVAVRLGDGAGAFAAVPDLASGSVRPFSTVVADFDGDGSLDVAAGSGEGPGEVMAWLGRGDGTFEPAPGAPYPIAEGPTGLGAGDVDGDGIDDIVVTSYLGDEAAVLLGGEQGFRPSQITLDDHPWGVAVGDVTGDGAADVVIANDGGDRMTFLRARAR